MYTVSSFCHHSIDYGYYSCINKNSQIAERAVSVVIHITDGTRSASAICHPSKPALTQYQEVCQSTHHLHLS